MANDDVIFKFLDKGNIHGIPAEDLTEEKFNKLPLLLQNDVRSGKLYEPVEPVNLAKMTREELNAEADRLGVEGYAELRTKQDVADAIEARKAELQESDRVLTGQVQLQVDATNEQPADNTGAGGEDGE